MLEKDRVRCLTWSMSVYLAIVYLFWTCQDQLLFIYVKQSPWILHANHYSRMPIIFYALGDGSSPLPVPFNITVEKSYASGQYHQKHKLKDRHWQLTRVWSRKMLAQTFQCWLRCVTSTFYTCFIVFLNAFIKIGEKITKLRLAAKNRVEQAIRKKFGSRFNVEFFGSIQYVD